MAFCWICGNKYEISDGQPISPKPEHKTYRICLTCQDQKTKLYGAEDPQEHIAYFERFIFQIKDPVVLDGIKEILAIPEQKEIPKDILKPCPCCGAKAELGRCDSGFNINCPACGLMTRWCASDKEAQTLWNRRIDS